MASSLLRASSSITSTGGSCWWNKKCTNNYYASSYATRALWHKTGELSKEYCIVASSQHSLKHHYRGIGGGSKCNKFERKYFMNATSTQSEEFEPQAAHDSKSMLESIKDVVDVLQTFSRPYALIVTTLGIISTSLLAVEKLSDLSPTFFIGLLQYLAAFLGNYMYHVGLNQLADVEIDKINKPYLPVLDSGREAGERVGDAVEVDWNTMVCAVVNGGSGGGYLQGLRRSISKFEDMDRKGVLAQIEKKMAAAAKKRKKKAAPPSSVEVIPSASPTPISVPQASPVRAPPASPARASVAESIHSTSLDTSPSTRPLKRKRPKPVGGVAESSAIPPMLETTERLVQLSKLIHRQAMMGEMELRRGENKKLRAQFEEATNRCRILEGENEKFKFALGKKDTDMQYVDGQRVEAEAKAESLKKKLEESVELAEKYKADVEARAAEVEAYKKELEVVAKSAEDKYKGELEVAIKSSDEAAKKVEDAEKDVEDAWAAAQDAVDETFEVIMAQVRHLASGVDFSVVSTKNIFDPVSNTIKPREELPE